MGRFENDSIFWIEVDKIVPNPYQPRRDFDEERLRDLADSIRQYGVLQPLTVTRNEKEKESGGIEVEYELIAGERRHRAAEMAGLSQVPAIIRSGEETSKMKLELAIIENLQREDLNPIERAQAFQRLNNEFEFKHSEIAEKIGKSREYVSNSIRLLKLPEEMQNALMAGKITEGHARPLMMLRDKPEEQETLFKEIIYKDLTVRESEEIARRIARDKVRNKDSAPDPETVQAEEELSESLGTRVRIERKDEGGKLIIDFFSEEDLESLLDIIKNAQPGEAEDMMERYIQKKKEEAAEGDTESAQDPETVAEAQAQLEEEQIDQKDTKPDTDMENADDEESNETKDGSEEDDVHDAGSAGASGVASAAEIIAQAENAESEEPETAEDTSPAPEQLNEEVASVDEEEAASIVSGENISADDEMEVKEDRTEPDESTEEGKREAKESVPKDQSADALPDDQREQIADLISDHFGDEVNEQVMQELSDNNETSQDQIDQNDSSESTNQSDSSTQSDNNEDEKSKPKDDDEDLYSVTNFSV